MRKWKKPGDEAAHNIGRGNRWSCGLFWKYQNLVGSKWGFYLFFFNLPDSVASARTKYDAVHCSCMHVHPSSSIIIISLSPISMDNFGPMPNHILSSNIIKCSTVYKLYCGNRTNNLTLKEINDCHCHIRNNTLNMLTMSRRSYTRRELPDIFIIKEVYDDDHNT